MNKLWRGFVNTIFWSYERGSWPYDVMVIIIVIFVLLSPRYWFQDQSQQDRSQQVALANSDIQLVQEDPGRQMRTYRLDAKALPPEKRTAHPTPELERETHDILGRTVDDLKGHTFQVQRIDAVKSDDGMILYYDVTVHP
jgi:hypothetical protein